MGKNDGRYVTARPFDLVRMIQNIQTRLKTLEAGNIGPSSFTVPDTNSIVDAVSATTPAGDPASGQLVYTQSISPINVDGDFESVNALNGITTWGGLNGATVAVDGGNGVLHQVGSGAGSLLMTPDGVSANPIAASELCPCTGGSQYTLSIWTYSDQGWATTQVGIAYYDVGNVLISTTLAAAYAITAGNGSMQVLTDTSPANAVSAQIVVQLTGTPTSATTLAVDTAWIVPGTIPASQSLASAITANAGFDQYGNGFQQGATLNIANITGAIALSTGVPGGSAAALDPDIEMPLTVTSTIQGVIEAALLLTTADPSEVMPGVAGSLILGTGTAAKQATLLTSPFAAQGSAIAFLSQNDGATDTSGILFGTVTTPDNSTLVFTPLAAIYPTALVIYGGTAGAGVQTVVTKTSGSGTIPVPASSQGTAYGECWGGGGGGANGAFGSAGGGAEYSADPGIVVTPGGTVSFVVGAGGGGGGLQVDGSNRNGGNGGNSTLTGASSTITAHGGFGGTSVGAGSGGSGYTGPISHPGGFGGGRPHGAQAGGGGGSSGGTKANGGYGINCSGNTGGNGGVAPAGGGNGGRGGDAPSDNNGHVGYAPGGGGGAGAHDPTSGAAHSGYAGANGQVRITFTATGTPAPAYTWCSAAVTDLYGNSITPGIGGVGIGVTQYAIGGSGQTFTTTSPVGITNLSFQVVPGYYRVHGNIKITMGGTGGVIILGWTGPAVSTVRIATAWQGVTQFNTDINVGVNKRDMGSLTNNQSPTLTAGVVYDVSLDGFIVFSAGGTLVATLQEATAGVSFSTVGGSSFMDVTRIS